MDEVRLMGFLATVVAVLLLALPRPAQGDFAADHPEWFGLTSGPPNGATMVGSSSLTAAVVLRPSATSFYESAIEGLADMPLYFLHAGEIERGTMEEFMDSNGLSLETVNFVDLEVLNTSQVGEYMALPISAGGEMVLVDPRYYPNRPNDDAAGSRMAEYFGTCAYRPPLFMTRGFVDSDGEGLCVVSSKLYGKTPALSEAEAKGQLNKFLGCQTIVKLQGLQNDAEGRLDTFFRFAPDKKALIGEYDAAQDGANRLILQANKELLETVLPEGFQVSAVLLPSPIQAGNSTLRPSYLHYLATSNTLLVPVFKDDLEHEDEALAVLKQVFVGKAVHTVESTAVVQSSSRLTSLLAPLPDLPWNLSCEAPEVLCESGHPLDCDLCYDECLKTEKVCVTATEYGKCAKSADGCYDLTVLPCQDDDVCENGNCVAPPGPCDDMPAGGRCNGDVVESCVQDLLIKVDCADSNEFCIIDEADEAVCVPICRAACTVGESYCVDHTVYVCKTGANGCPEGVIEEECGAGLVCDSGTCVAGTVAEEGGGDVAGADGPGPGGDNSDWNAGYKEKDGGCSSSPVGRGGAWWLLLVAMLVPAALRRRRRWATTCAVVLALVPACSTGGVSESTEDLAFAPPAEIISRDAPGTSVGDNGGGDFVPWQPEVTPPELALVETWLKPDTVTAGEEKTVVTCMGYDAGGNYVGAGPTHIEAPPEVKIDDAVLSSTSAGAFEVRCVPEPASDVKVKPATLTVLAAAPASFSITLKPDKEVYVVGNKITVTGAGADKYGNELTALEVVGLAISPDSLGIVIDNKITLKKEGTGTISGHAPGQPSLSDSAEIIVDQGPPLITVSQPKRGAQLKGTGKVTVEGQITDSTGVKSATLNGGSLKIAADGTFEVEIQPKQGLNLVDIFATDTFGNGARMLQSFVFAEDYYPVLGNDLEAMMVYDGIVAWLDYDAFAGGNGPEGTSLSWIVQEFLLKMELGDLIPSPAAQQSILLCTYDIYLNDLSYEDPEIKLWPTPDGLMLSVKFPNLYAELEAPAPFCPDLAGNVTASAVSLTSLALLEIGSDGALSVELTNVDVKFTNLQIDLYGVTGALLEGVLFFFQDTLTEMMEEKFESEVAAQFETTLGQLLGNIAVDQWTELPPFMPGAKPTDAEIHLRGTGLETAYGGLKFHLKAAFTAANQKQGPLLGSVGRVGCLKGDDMLADVPGQHYLEIAMHDDVLNQSAFAKFSAGGIDFIIDGATMAAMGTDPAELGAENLMVTGSAQLPPVLTDCADGHYHVELGELKMKITMDMLGMPLEMVLYLYFSAKAFLEAVGEAGDQSIVLTFGEVDWADFHLESVNEEWAGNEAVFAELIEETFLAEFMSMIQEYPYVIPISEFPVGDLLPAFSGWTFVPVVDEIVRKKGHMLIRAHLLVNE